MNQINYFHFQKTERLRGESGRGDAPQQSGDDARLVDVDHRRDAAVDAIQRHFRRRDVQRRWPRRRRRLRRKAARGRNAHWKAPTGELPTEAGGLGLIWFGNNEILILEQNFYRPEPNLGIEILDKTQMSSSLCKEPSTLIWAQAFLFKNLHSPSSSFFQNRACWASSLGLNYSKGCIFPGPDPKSQMLVFKGIWG